MLDTETTGLDPVQGHRIVEIGAVELINHIPSGRHFHVYLDPERDMPREAEAIHGLSRQFLRGKPVFTTAALEFLEFISDASLVIHNASFDIAFLNAEFTRANHPVILPERVIDTLMLARSKHPMGPNSLDALCKRYGIDTSRRTKHGALLDAELLADVYLDLIGGRQSALSLTTLPLSAAQQAASIVIRIAPRPRPLLPRVSAAEIAAHQALVADLGEKAIWRSIRP
ncbi:DNA polymerase III subunit epsilon [soil metagenome]